MEKKGESVCVFPAADVSVSPGAILSVPPVKLDNAGSRPVLPECVWYPRRKKMDATAVKRKKSPFFLQILLLLGAVALVLLGNTTDGKPCCLLR